jgi:hypothetical protein
LQNFALTTCLRVEKNGGCVGCDADKQIKNRKRHMLVDTRLLASPPCDASSAKSLCTGKNPS